MNKDYNKKEDETAIVCMRCDELISPVHGAIVKKCSFCGAKVWMAPASQNMKVDKIYCMECWELDYNEKEDQVYYTKDTIEEFNDWLFANRGYKMSEDEILKMVEQGTGVKLKKQDSQNKPKES